MSQTATSHHSVLSTTALELLFALASGVIAVLWTYFRQLKPTAVAALQKKGNPYLEGNFAPIQRTLPLTACQHVGHLPRELLGGQYVRNGGNPVTNEELGRDAHWFDGDGMLSGVAFFEGTNGAIEPSFVNQYILTDVFLSSATTSSLRTPILPSVTTLINPFSSLITITAQVLRTLSLVVMSRLPGSLQAIKKISVANTGLLYHDGRALATCESGPPMRILLPSLDTVGWFNGDRAEGEPEESSSTGAQEPIGGSGALAFMREWTTAHPRVDPQTGELLLFHSTFVPPYVRYSILSGDSPTHGRKSQVNMPIPGVASPKMMHDFGVSATHTIILDLPLSLAPQNLARNLPVVSYDKSSPSRFGVFPRRDPWQIRWFESDACCIFHTANAWDTDDAVHLLACRLTSASLIFSAGGLSIPSSDEDQCRLYYYQFPLDSSSREISQQWALLSLPFEFPSLPNHLSMSPARYIYGCSSTSNFSAALGRAVKIDALVRVDVKQLIARGLENPPTPVTGCVDNRTLQEIVASSEPDDPVRVFQLPEGWYAQEPRFVPREGGIEEEGWLLTYVFDESQLDENGEVGDDAVSELWVIDAVRMSEGMDAVIARVKLPQRVPYGLHGNWFSRDEVENQRAYDHLRDSLVWESKQEDRKGPQGLWKNVRRTILEFLQ